MTTKDNKSPGLDDPRRKRDYFGVVQGIGIPAQYGSKDGGYMEVNLRNTPTLPYKIPTKLN